jgi:hypothetical protein
MKKTKSLKAIVLSLGLAALMAPATLNAQINHGLLQNPYKTESGKNHGMMNSRGDRTEVSNSGSFYNEEFGAPLGSGVLLLLAAGIGYATLKKKEDEQ